ncbi:uncharacterized protein LOC115676402 [Syzygium oleosum]|uniref:uncharacterized protein LOC115676402 n=1 Tax=Syzygium oleosum TaxID=219896 RepID=UPI0011D271C8|nr:uncharacterized protein LOC115676402 [Syzygium oleosum]
MAKFNCFSMFVGRKKKVDEETTLGKDKAVQVTFEHPVKPYKADELKSTTFSVSVPFGIDEKSKYNVKIVSDERPVVVDSAEVAYEGEDEHEEHVSIKRDFSDSDLQSHEANNLVGEEYQSSKGKMISGDLFDADLDTPEIKSENFVERDNDMIQGGHVSDPGMTKVEFWGSPMLKRSCSGLETREVMRTLADQLPPSKSQSFEELQDLSRGMREDINPGSPVSVMTRFSADKVMLKKHSSSQVLPSRSRRLWWKLFLWSHRNMQKPQNTKPKPIPALTTINQQGGYSSDTIEPNRAFKFGKMESPGSFTGEYINQVEYDDKNEKKGWDGFRGSSGLWPQNQWVAFPAESSSFKRVDDWVKDLCIDPSIAVDDAENSDKAIIYPPSPESIRSPTRSAMPLHKRQDINLSEEMLHANSVIQTLNSSSTVAHISGMGLRVIPTMSLFSSLKSVNLSGNCIVRIPPGSLPKGLHVLDLSRNKINAIEGLRELTRLHILDLSYNRISRIGHGLSNCTLVKELYLAGNKISDVEGLHRLLKLTVLDLSFNKITTTKALGQLVANYNSLQALNLLGNPIHSNISNDQLRKAVCSLLPKLVYLNKQPIKQQRARDVLTDSVAKAALGGSSRGSYRKAAKRSSQGGSLSSRVNKSSAGAGHKSKSKSKSHSRHHSALKNA